MLHRIADGKIGAVERAFLNSIRVQARSIDRSALGTALIHRDVEAAFAAVGLNGQLETRLRAALTTSLHAAFTQAGVSTAAIMAPTLGVTARFDLTNPRATRWAAQRSATAVREVTRETKAVIRQVIARGFREGVTVAESGRALRPYLLDDPETSVGLTRRQYGAVERLRERLATAGAEDIDEQAAKYAGKLLRTRAETIARTETIAASSAGQSELWQQFADKGLIDAEQTVRVWIITPDDRLCDICEAIPTLNPDGVGLDEPFLTPEGPVDDPPAHPRCRCATGLEFTAADEAAAA